MAHRAKKLADEELEYFANHLSDISIDDLDVDENWIEDEPDPVNFEISAPDFENNFEELIENMPVETEDGIVIGSSKTANNNEEETCKNHNRNIDEQVLQEIRINPVLQNQPSTSKEPFLKNKKAKKVAPPYDLKSLKWRKENLIIQEEELEFRGNDNLPENISLLPHPYSFFKYFFTDEMINNIVEQSNLYSVQKDPSKPANIVADDVIKYIGICFYMSVAHLPSIRSYWSGKIGYEKVMNIMSLRSFEKIRETLHFNDNSQANNSRRESNKEHDRLYKIRPVIDNMRKRFQTIPFEKCLSVDEQLCATKVRHYLLQYLPLKPHKWGFKFFVVSGVSGFTYDFEIYTGSENDNTKRLDTEPDLGASANVVVRLLRNVTKDANHRVYFDNYYTSLPLITFLNKNGIYSLGTIRRNRIPNCPLPSEAAMKKNERGSSCEFITEIEGKKISLNYWKDTKSVILCSSFCGELPKGKVQRFSKEEKKKIDVECPKAIGEYNRHMGGVDLMDSLIGRYKIRIRSKKWYFRIFYHLLDVCMVNAWLMYRRVKRERGENNILSLCDFRAEVAQSMCEINQQPLSRKRGRPRSSLEGEIVAKMRKKSATAIPPEPVRKDMIGHWPIFSDKRERCKMPRCKGFSYITCEKCKAHLCLRKTKSCYINFHN